MTRIERLKDQIAKEKRKLAEADRRGSLFIVKQSRDKIDMLHAMLEEAEAYAPRKLSEQLSKEMMIESGILKLIIKTHMAADFLCDVAFTFREAMDKLGFDDCSLYAPLKTIEKAAADYAALVCHPEFAGLQDFMITNETFLQHLSTLSDRYLADHLQITFADESEECKISYRQRG